MKRPLFGYVLLSCFALSVAYALALRKDSFTSAEVMPVAAGLFCMLVLWYWMVCNLIANRKKLAHPLAWGLFLFFGSWIAAPVYFFVKYAPAEEGPPFRRFRAWLVRGDSARAFYARVALVSLGAAVFHHFLTDTLYLMVPLHDFPVYHNIVGVIYAPCTAAITAVYRVLSIDTSHPSKDLVLFARAVRFFYTYLLILVLALQVSVRERRKAASREGARR